MGEDAALEEAREQRELKTRIGSALPPLNEGDSAKALARNPFSKLKVSPISLNLVPIQEGVESDAAENPSSSPAPVVKVSPTVPVDIREPDAAEGGGDSKKNRGRPSLFGLGKRISESNFSDRENGATNVGDDAELNGASGTSGRVLSEAPVSGIEEGDVHKMLTPDAALARFSNSGARETFSTRSEIPHEIETDSQPSKPNSLKEEVSIPPAASARASAEGGSKRPSHPEKVVDSEPSRKPFLAKLFGKEGSQSSAAETGGSDVSEPAFPGPGKGAQVPKGRVVIAGGGTSSVGRRVRPRDSVTDAAAVSQAKRADAEGRGASSSSATSNIVASMDRQEAGSKQGLLQRLFETGERVPVTKVPSTDDSQSTSKPETASSDVGNGGGERPASDDVSWPATTTPSDGYVPLVFGPSNPGNGHQKPEIDLLGGVELPALERELADADTGNPKVGFFQKLIGASSASGKSDLGGSSTASDAALSPSGNMVGGLAATDPDSELGAPADFNPGDQVAHESPILVAIGDFGGGRFVGKNGTPSKPLEYAMVVQKLSDGAVWSKVRVPKLGEGYLPSSQLRPASFDETIAFIRKQQKP